MNYKQDLKKVMILYPEIEVLSSDDYLHLINIHNILEATGKDIDSDMVKKAFEDRDSLPLKTANDYFYLVTKTVAANKTLKKMAYPMMMGALSEEPPEEFDLEKWAGLVYKIYDAVSAGDMSLNNAIDYYANTLDKRSGECDNFKKWVIYYNSGEHVKYNSSNNSIKKEADYQFPLNGGGFYPSDVFGDLSRDEEGRPSDGEKQQFEVAKKKSEEKDEYTSWKDKLHGAIRRIDKLLRMSDKWIDPDTIRELADLLHAFDLEVRGIRHVQTASDRAFNVAGKFKKLGFDQGSEVLMKYAQEVPMPEATTGPEDLVPDVEDREDVPEPAPDEELLPGTEEEVPGVEGGSLERALGPGRANEDEYEEIEGDVTLEDASRKLEEIAARLADRRTIRNLAEFDIMLDKIGIASMFPELAEAQSKLIDAYSYALTRVTKMLGMVSSGRGAEEISDARKKELVNKTMKEVNKTFEPEPEEGAAPAAIEEEFGGGAAPAPVPEEPIEPAEPVPPVATPEV
jgi:hypothetical protein